MQVTYGKGFAVAPKNERIAKFDAVLQALPQADCPIRESFLNGLYIRQITIPKGVAIVGAVHKSENVVMINKGVLRVVTEDGFRDVKAGDTLTIQPGQKNCVYAIEECVWTNIFANPTNERDTKKLVEMLSESKASDLLGGATNKQLAANRLAELES